MALPSITSLTLAFMVIVMAFTTTTLAIPTYVRHAVMSSQSSLGKQSYSHPVSHEYYGLSTLGVGARSRNDDTIARSHDAVAVVPTASSSSSPFHSAAPMVGPPNNLIPVIGIGGNTGVVNNGNGPSSNNNMGSCNPAGLVQRIRPFCGMYLAPSAVPVVRPSLACCRTLSTINLTCFCDDVVFGNGLPNVDQSKASDVYQACTFSNPNFPICTSSVRDHRNRGARS